MASLALPGTRPLDWEGDIAERMVHQADQLLLRELQQSIARRAAHWSRDAQSPAAYQASIEPNRRRLAHILGVRNARQGSERMWLVGTVDQPATVAENRQIRVQAVRWQTFGRIEGEGLLLLPVGREPVADIVAVADPVQSPESLSGLEPLDLPSHPYARRLAESGCRVLVPWIVDRHLREWNGRAELTTREYLYRSAFELGRHVIGYEVQKILAGVDWCQHTNGGARPVGVIGWGDGGMLALYAAALDTRIDAACVSGHFQPREAIWQEPIDRNVFGLLEQFGDAELASMVAPRALLVEAARGPELVLESGKGGAPGTLASPALPHVRAEYERAQQLVGTLSGQWPSELIETPRGQGPPLSDATLQRYLQLLRADAVLSVPASTLEYRGDGHLAALRKERQLQQMDDQTQWFLRESAYVRQQYMKQLDTSSVEAYTRSVEPYRRFFRDEVIGHFDYPLVAPRRACASCWKPMTGRHTKSCWMSSRTCLPTAFCCCHVI